MPDCVIQVEHLTKEFRLGVIGHGTLYRDLQSWWARWRGKDDPNSLIRPDAAGPLAYGLFRALDDVSFQVERGETLALLGPNGAGKSTLLKILSRITGPTRGRIVFEDRIASLLEVGTGFHMEMTGRQNIFMNGAMLGMRRSEILRKFDRIVDFSGVERFIDTPVKRYSSGMYVRLAFAIAAHLDAEILLVDEVLAVGDAEFQKKCLAKMRDVTQNEGRTVLFVSHNTEAIRHLCRRAILLENGKLVLETNDIDAAIRRYRTSTRPAGAYRWENNRNDSVNPWFTPRKMALVDGDGRTLDSPISPGDEARLVIEGDVETPNENLAVGYHLRTGDGMPIYCSFNTDSHDRNAGVAAPGRIALVSRLPVELLNAGLYQILLDVHLLRGEKVIVHPDRGRGEQITFEIGSPPGDSSSQIGRRPGCIAPVIPWTIQPAEAVDASNETFFGERERP